jgi:hypothetical protein
VAGEEVDLVSGCEEPGLGRSRWGSRRIRLLPLLAILVLGVFAPSAHAFVYWADTDEGTIGRATADGKAVEQQFIGGIDRPCGVAVDSTHVYWASEGGSIGRANRDGSGIQPNFITGASAPCGVAVDASHIYWASTGSGKIGRASLDGSGVNQDWVIHSEGACGVAVNETHVYWGMPSSVARAHISGVGADKNFVDHQVTGGLVNCGVALDSEHVYWTGYGLGRASLQDGSGGIQLGLTDGCGVAVNSTHLYWAQGGTPGYIGRAQRDGSNPDWNLIATEGSPCGVAVDEGQAAQAEVNPDQLDFGSQEVSTSSAPQVLTVSNPAAADGPLNVGALSIGGQDPEDFTLAVDGCSAASVAPGEDCTVDVTFTPQSLGGKRAALLLPSNGLGGLVEVPLSGEAAHPDQSVAPSALDFGSHLVGTPSPSQTVTLTNGSGATGPDLVGQATVVGSDPEAFTITADDCSGASVAIGASCTVEVAFDPASDGARSAALRIPSDDPTSPATVSLSGSGVSPRIEVDSAAIAFGDQLVDTAAAPRALIISNGAGASAPLQIGTLTLGGTTPGQFSLSEDGCSGQTLAAGASCTVEVGFTPASLGGKSAQLTIPSNAPSSPTQIPVSGNGTDPAQTISPIGIKFGQERVGAASPTRTVTLTNGPGATAPDAVSTVSLAGPEADQFAIASDGCSGTTLAIDESCQVKVRFTPDVEGFHRASLEISSDDPTSPASTSLFGEGVAPHLEVDPASHSFDSQIVGTSSAPVTVTVANAANATAPLAVGQIVLAGANASQFATSADGCSGQSLNPGDSCTIKIAFGPTSPGLKSATLSVPSDGSVGTVDVPLTGAGVTTAIEIDASSHDFGDQLVGTTSAAQTVTVTNGASASATLEPGPLSIQGTASDQFQIVPAGDQCSGAMLAPGQGCTVEVVFAPTSLGSKPAQLAIPTNDPSSPTEVLLSGTGTDPDQSVSPSAIDFGAKLVGTTSSTQTVTLGNGAGASATDVIEAVDIAGPDADRFQIVSDGCSGQSVPIGGDCEIGLRFAPTAIGPRSATLRIASDDPTSPATVSLSGEGVAPRIEVDAERIDFGDELVDTAAAPRTLTISNGAGASAPLQIGTLTLGGTAPGQFSLSEDQCSGQTLSAGASCTVKAIFTPTSLGGKAARVTIPSDDPTSPTQVPLTGTGTDPAQTVSPSSLDFGKQLVGTTSALQTVTLGNGPGASAPDVIEAVDIAGADADRFQIVSDSCSGQTLAAGAQCQVKVRFVPTTVGTRTALLEIASDDSSSPASVPLEGEGVAPEAELKPAAIPFGGQMIGTSSGPVTLTVANGAGASAPLAIGQIVLAGANQNQFATSADGCSGQSLDPGASCTIKVAFGPTTVGAKSANLQIPSDDPTGAGQVPLSGTGVSTALEIDTGGLDFGAQLVGTTSSTRKVTIANGSTATVSLRLDALSLAGQAPDQFQLVPGSDHCSGATLAAGENCTVEVAFVPTSLGGKSAQLTAPSNAPGSPVRLPLSGNGTDPAQSISPSAIDFGKQMIGTASTTRTVTLANGATASAPDVIEGVELSGPDQDQFEITADGCSDQTVPIDGDCKVTLRFAPTATGPRAATLEIASDDPTSPASVSLSGDGTTPEIELGSKAVAFGDQPVHTAAAPRTVTIANGSSATAPLQLGTLALDGAGDKDFRIASDGCSEETLTPGDSCTVRVVFAPTASGPISAALQAPSNDPAQPNTTISLSGTGVTSSDGSDKGDGAGKPDGGQPQVGAGRCGTRSFQIRRIKHFRHRGFARMRLHVPCPGKIVLKETKRIKGNVKEIDQAGIVTLIIRYHGHALHDLRHHRRWRAHVTVFFFPLEGGRLVRKHRIRLAFHTHPNR